VKKIINKSEILSQIKYNKEGLIPVIIQDEKTNQVLMLAYMNEESLEKTLEERRTCFYSRSRRELWFKESKGDNIEEIKIESPVYLQKEQAEKQKSPQKEARSETSETDSEIINELYQVIQDRKLNYQSNSYVCKLLANSEDLLPKKIGEEAVEVIIALKDKEKSAIIFEVADLCFHTLVALGNFNISPQEIFEELKRRRK